MKIIGITGPARSGKDTLAGEILRLADNGTRMSFAAPIRSFIAGLLDVTVSELEDGFIKESPQADFGGKSPRQMMQTLGTEWGRELIDQNLWITVARRKLQGLAAVHRSVRPDVVVFSDVRFENEAAMIRSAGGTIIHLSRRDAVPVNSHVSEAGVLRAVEDRAIQNDGTIDSLRSNARLLLAG